MPTIQSSLCTVQQFFRRLFCSQSDIFFLLFVFVAIVANEKTRKHILNRCDGYADDGDDVGLWWRQPIIYSNYKVYYYGIGQVETTRPQRAEVKTHRRKRTWPLNNWIGTKWKRSTVDKFVFTILSFFLFCPSVFLFCFFLHNSKSRRRRRMLAKRSDYVVRHWNMQMIVVNFSFVGRTLFEWIGISQTCGNAFNRKPAPRAFSSQATRTNWLFSFVFCLCLAIFVHRSILRFDALSRNI